MIIQVCYSYYMKLTLNEMYRMLMEKQVMDASEINILTERLELKCITPLDI